MRSAVTLALLLAACKPAPPAATTGQLSWRAARMVLLAGDEALSVADETPMMGGLGMPLADAHGDCRALCAKSTRRELPTEIRALVERNRPAQ